MGLMRIIARKTLKDFWEILHHRDAEQPLKAWFKEAEDADWITPAEVKRAYRSASFISSDRVVFNIAGNKYRLVVRINYPYHVIYIRFVGTHKEYDKINVKEI